MRIDFHKEPPVDCDPKTLMRIIRSTFSQRKKSLVNSLGSEFSQYNKTQLAEFIVFIGLDANIRGEKLSLEQFATLVNVMM